MNIDVYEIYKNKLILCNKNINLFNKIAKKFILKYYNGVGVDKRSLT